MEYTVYVYWKRGIIDADVQALIDAVNDFANILRTTQAINMPNDNVRICGVNPELESFVRYLPKVRTLTNAGAICEHLHKMHSEYSIGVYLTDEPICNGETYQVGLTRFRNITVSIYHFRNISSSSDRFTSIKLCVMHELGHAHGMAGDTGRVKSEYNGGPHCADSLCLMQQPGGTFIPIIRRHYSRWFCSLCLEDARLAKRRFTEQARNVLDLTPKSNRLPPPLPPRRR